MELNELAPAVTTTSVPYRDSTAFQKALSHIKKTDIELYKQLLTLECEEMGCFD